MAEASMVMAETSSESRLRLVGMALFAVVIGIGVAYVAINLVDALEPVRSSTAMPFLLLAIALLIALGFEFVNGFHDTANAVATVIYTHSLPPHAAVIWSGICNFVGVLLSSGGVAFAIVSLLPVELILQVGSGAGFAMVFALLIAAIIWNLGTWALGIPNSSSHALIGSVIGVGLMNQLIGGASGTSGVDWNQAMNIGEALLFSPLVGFTLSAGLLLLAKRLIRIPKLYTAPVGKAPPPFWIRVLLILTCTGVSYAHGSNDGQKGMGLIMLILIGTVPTAFALNRAVTPEQTIAFEAVAREAAATIRSKIAPDAPASENFRKDITDFVRTREAAPVTLPALAALTEAIGAEVKEYGTFAAVPQGNVNNVRNDMYLSGEAITLLQKAKVEPMTSDEIKAYQANLKTATKFIPTWVKVAVAVALGMGTMVGWKRIVVTVGEKIGKEHLTYGQGAAAELVAAITIQAADMWHLPVSTTHVLSSGVAGTMAANGSGLQAATVRSLIMAWVLTLPASIALAGGLFWLFRLMVGA
jgi:PiT family inorganic phosphate transporter